ncbi:hypothetical protein [Lacticaseibacillus jixiensis]|uniref:hypothetical protein n=1 Tax=Lacticaseibacillus jixiensis TaxID=3231926 RepID=UPI0036F414F7
MHDEQPKRRSLHLVIKIDAICSMRSCLFVAIDQLNEAHCSRVDQLAAAQLLGELALLAPLAFAAPIMYPRMTYLSAILGLCLVPV